MSPIDLVVLGAGGNSLAIVDAVHEINRCGERYRIVGILDDLDRNRDARILGVPVVGRLDDAWRYAGCRFVNGIASQASYRIKPQLIARTGIAHDRFETIVHPAAVVSAAARLGRGSAVMAGSAICPLAAIGDHVIVLQNTVINHHATVNDHATLSSGVTVLGYATIGRSAFIGGGVSVAPYVGVGEGALVGMGAVVIRDVAPGVTVAGNPARPMRPREPVAAVS